MNNKLAYVFPGQGAQYVGMGNDIYRAFPEAKEVFDKADEILGFSLTKLCFQGPRYELRRTENCQPAIFTVSIACLEALRDQSPELTAGLSVGEYAALVAAEVLNFEDALRLVRIRAQFMEEEAKRHPGKMLAVIGLSLEEVKTVCRDSGAELANINCPNQVVISAKTEDAHKAAKLAEDKGARRVVTLETNGAFHSSLMEGAAWRLKEELDKVRFSPAKVPVISNVTAQPQEKPDEIRHNLFMQIKSTVLWEDSIRFMLKKGIKTFLEIGPGKVLKGLIRRIDSEVKVHNMETKEDILNLVSG